MAHAHPRDTPPQPAPAEAATAFDPVCGMTVAVATARHTHEHHGVRHYFCSPRCREKFIADPERYLQPQAAAAMPEPTADTPVALDVSYPQLPRSPCCRV